MKDLPPSARPAVGERWRIGASLLAPGALLWLAARRGWIPLPPRWGLAVMLGLFCAAFVAPRCFAGWYRAFSAGQSWLGRRLVALLLGLVFVVVMVPVGLILRWSGKSFLGGPSADSYWKPAQRPGSLRDQF